MNEIINAQIEDTQLGFEDHGIMTCGLTLDYGDGGHQGFGGYGLDKPYKKAGKFVKRIGSAYGMGFVMEILKVVGVEEWEDLKGKYVRVKMEDTEKYNKKIEAIGNITKDKWFNPKEFYEEMVAIGEEEKTE